MGSVSQPYQKLEDNGANIDLLHSTSPPSTFCFICKQSNELLQMLMFIFPSIVQNLVAKHMKSGHPKQFTDTKKHFGGSTSCHSYNSMYFDNVAIPPLSLTP
jgi:hypothetical protein